jgi:hypothetical protein
MLPDTYRCDACFYFRLPNAAPPPTAPRPGAVDYPRRGLCQRYPVPIEKQPTDRCGDFASNEELQPK